MKGPLARTRDEAWLRSNPVAILQARLRQEGLTGIGAERRAARALFEQGQRLSAHYWRSLGLDVPKKTRRHGVVGLIVGRDRAGAPFGWVDRLKAKAAPRWTGRAGLPFDPLELLGVLLRLLGARGAEQLLHVLPEAKAFRIEDELDADIQGPSMTIAGALAVLDAASGRKRAELRAATSFVQLAPGVQLTGPPTRADRSPLVPVEGIRAKLEGFQRECGRGSLAIVAPDGPVPLAQLRRHFERVWVVADLGELGARLEDAGLLEDFAQPEALRRNELDRVEGLLARFNGQDWLVRRSLDLARRLAAVERGQPGFAPDVSPERRRRASTHAFRPLRYEAALGEVVRAAQAACARSAAAAEAASYEELCGADLNLAGAFYVEYRFAEMAALLAPWAERLAADPRLVSPYLRVRVLGGMARALAVEQPEPGAAPAWAPYFEAAVELQGRVDPAQLSLTRGFHVAALLAADQLDEAETQIELAEAELLRDDYAENLSLWFLRFDRADLARRRGELWQDKPMERRDVLKEGQFGRAMGYYFQATARQLGREPEDAAKRFERAAEFFGGGPPPPNSGLWWFVFLCRLGAAERRGDASAWAAARAELLAFLEEDWAAGLASWFGELPGGLPAELPARDLDATAADREAPAQVALARLFERDPYVLGRGPRAARATPVA